MRALVEFLAGYDERYRSVAQGYPQEAIDELARELGRPLPAAYRDFLETAAANLGFETPGLSFDLEEVRELTQNVKDSLPPFLTPIAIDESQSFADYYMDLRHPAGKGDGRVIRMAEGSTDFDDAYVDDASLRDLLFPRGYRRMRMALFPEYLRVVMDAPAGSTESHATLGDQAHRVFVQLGFKELLGLTGPVTRFFERGDCAALLVVPGSTCAGAQLAGVDRRTLETVAETLGDNVAAQTRLRPW